MVFPSMPHLNPGTAALKVVTTLETFKRLLACSSKSRNFFLSRNRSASRSTSKLCVSAGRDPSGPEPVLLQVLSIYRPGVRSPLADELSITTRKTPLRSRCLKSTCFFPSFPPFVQLGAKTSSSLNSPRARRSQNAFQHHKDDALKRTKTNRNFQMNLRHFFEVKSDDLI